MILKMSTLALLAAAVLFGADPTGVWKADYTSPDGAARSTTFHLKAEGEKVTGKLASQMGEAEIKDGTIKGDDISFSVLRNFGGNEMLFKYTGKVAADEIKLKVSFGDGDRSMDIVAKKQAN